MFLRVLARTVERYQGLCYLLIFTLGVLQRSQRVVDRAVSADVELINMLVSLYPGWAPITMDHNEAQ